MKPRRRSTRRTTALTVRLQRGAVFINIGRGATVKLADLDAALRSGHLAGASLDVFERGPLPATTRSGTRRESSSRPM